MFDLFLWGIALYGLIILGLQGIKLIYRITGTRHTYHYFILVKNGEEMIEWVIRSINFDNWLEGKNKKISVFDLGSIDDTLAIIERLAYKGRKIDNLYMKNSNVFHLLGTKVEESKKLGEKPVILYINPHDKSSKIEEIHDSMLKGGGIS